jgi:hypothetical protein
VTCVEWGDRIADALPADRLEVSISTLPPDAVPPPPASTPGEASPEPRRRIAIRALGTVSGRALERLGAREPTARQAQGPQGIP